MSMDHPEGFGSASASEVPTRPPGPGYNFRPRSRSATAPKNRRLGPVELQGVGSTLDLPSITPPNSPTPRGAGIPTQESPDINLPTIISYDSTPSPTLMSKPIVSGVSGGSLQILGTRTGGVESVDSTLIPNTVGISRINPTIMTNTAVGAESPYSTNIQYPVGPEFLYSTHILKVFLPSGSPTILDFPHQTRWQYSVGNPLTGASNARVY